MATHSLTHSVEWGSPEDTEEVQGHWKFQHTAAHLTYKHHINKEAYIAWLTAKVKVGFKFLRLAHETADETHPYAHTHVLMKFNKRFVTENVRFFDYLETHPHIKGIDMRSRTQWDNTVQYITKEDPENADLIKEKSIVERVWNSDTLADALKHNAFKFSDVGGIIQAWGARGADEWDFRGGWHQRKFQTNIFNIIGVNKEPDGRSVHWHWEHTGCVGKTWTVKYLMKNWPRHFYIVMNSMAMRDFATVLDSAFDSGWNGHCILFYLVRGEENLKGFYGCLEAACDGLFTSTKYRGKTRMWGGAHVMVCANFKPNKYQKNHAGEPMMDKPTLSLDRWRIHEITKDELGLDMEHESNRVDEGSSGGDLTLGPPLEGPERIPEWAMP